MRFYPHNISGFSNFAERAWNNAVQRIPDCTISNPKVLKNIKWIGRHISSPQNRLILGISALMSQPFIDLSNKRVDDETRKSSAARTTAKIIAGTTTGFLVRYYAIKAAEAMTKLPGDKNLKSPFWQTLFTPKGITLRGLKQYKYLIGTLLATVTMLFTNVLIDAPLTNLLTNRFISKIKKDKNKNTQNTQIENSAMLERIKNANSTNLIKEAIYG